MDGQEYLDVRAVPELVYPGWYTGGAGLQILRCISNQTRRWKDGSKFTSNQPRKRARNLLLLARESPLRKQQILTA
jgi:hypothetical protein